MAMGGSAKPRSKKGVEEHGKRSGSEVSEWRLQKWVSSWECNCKVRPWSRSGSLWAAFYLVLHCWSADFICVPLWDVATLRTQPQSNHLHVSSKQRAVPFTSLCSTCALWMGISTHLLKTSKTKDAWWCLFLQSWTEALECEEVKQSCCLRFRHKTVLNLILCWAFPGFNQRQFCEMLWVCELSMEVKRGQVILLNREMCGMTDQNRMYQH